MSTFNMVYQTHHYSKPRKPTLHRSSPVQARKPPRRPPLSSLFLNKSKSSMTLASKHHHTEASTTSSIHHSIHLKAYKTNARNR